MASASHSLFFYVFFQFLILLLLALIHYSHSCPDPIDFYCPDNIFNGKLPPPLFNTSVNECRSLCDLSCQNRNTMINCTKEPPYQVLHINPFSLSIAVKNPDWRLPPCEVYSKLNASFPNFHLVSLTNWVENWTSFWGCPSPKGDKFWDSHPHTTCGDGNPDKLPIVYFPFFDGACFQPFPEGCMKFTKFYRNEGTKDDNNKVKTWIIIICSVLSGSAIVLIILIVYLKQRKNKSISANLSSRIESTTYTRSNLEEGSMNYGVTLKY